MKKIIIGLLCSFLLVGCGTSKPISNQSAVNEEEENKVSMDKNSFNFSLKSIEYNKKDNSLSVQYKTGLPDNTTVELILNPSHPDSWGKQYDPFYEYTKRMNQDVKTTVKNGLINYTFDNTALNGQLLPNSLFYITVNVPVNNQTNSSIMEEIGNDKEFEKKYPELIKQRNEAGYEIYTATENDNGYDVRFYDQYEMKNAYSIEEIYAYYKKETIPYPELEKNPSKYEGTPVAFSGKVLQIQEDEEEVNDVNTVVRLALNGNDDEVVYVTFNNSFGMEGVVKDDTITVYGKITGSETYTSVAGYEITIPSMEAIIYTE